MSGSVLVDVHGVACFRGICGCFVRMKGGPAGMCMGQAVGVGMGHFCCRARNGGFLNFKLLCGKDERFHQ